MKWEGILPNGEMFDLPAPISIAVSCDEDAPADQYVAVFPMEKPVLFTGIRADFSQGNYNFKLEGIVDSREWVRSASGCLLRVTARSRAALLLDNEAVPKTMTTPSLEKVFCEHVKPYGFTGFVGDSRSFTGELVITKGMSEWQAVEEFCMTFLHCRPYVKGNILYAGTAESPRSVGFGEEITYGRVAVLEEDFQRISELRIRQPHASGYKKIVYDLESRDLGIVRRRCFSQEKGENEQQILAQARREAFSIEVDCFQPPCIPILTDCTFSDPQFGNYTNLYISSLKYILDKKQRLCRYTLRKKEKE